MLQLHADAMIFVKNRLAKFYEQSTWQIVTNVWEIQFPGKIVSVILTNHEIEFKSLIPNHCSQNRNKNTM